MQETLTALPLADYRRAKQEKPATIGISRTLNGRSKGYSFTLESSCRLSEAMRKHPQKSDVQNAMGSHKRLTSDGGLAHQTSSPVFSAGSPMTSFLPLVSTSFPCACAKGTQTLMCSRALGDSEQMPLMKQKLIHS